MDARLFVSSKDPSRRLLSSLLLVGCLALAGCRTLNHLQCRIEPQKAEGVEEKAQITDADREAVREILQAKASELNLVDRTDRSLVPQTIAYFMALDTDSPMKLIAWEHENSILVDFLHAPDVVGETNQFRDAREQLFAQLRERFPGRVEMMAIRDVISAREADSP